VSRQNAYRVRLYRVRKLLALARSPSENEPTLAAHQAAQMKDSYGMDVSIPPPALVPEPTPTPTSVPVSESFERLWNLWPKQKAIQHREGAYSAWMAVSPDEDADLEQAVTAYVRWLTTTASDKGACYPLDNFIGNDIWRRYVRSEKPS
jgi:hypothetical protein